MLWNFSKSNQFLSQYAEHDNEVMCLDICEQDGNIIASGSGDTTVRIWDIRKKKSCVRILEGNTSIVNSVKFVPDSLYTLACAGDDSIIRLYDIRAFGELGNYQTIDGDRVISLSFSKSGRIIFGGYNNGVINIFDTFNESLIIGYNNHKGAVKCLSLSPDGKSLLSTSKDGTINLWQKK